MKCPKCQCEEISDSGVCLWCGYEVNVLPAESRLEVSAAGPGSKPPDINPQDVQEQIGVMTARKLENRDAPDAAPELIAPAPRIADADKKSRILLRRTLSGLVDIAIVALSASAFIMAADYFSGTRMLNSAGMIHYSALFLLVYFLYSLFFLGLSNQTVGMMLTNLYLVAYGEEKFLKMHRIFARCCGYLLSLFCLGIGLIWALFDQENRCLHDRWTNSRVARPNILAPRNSKSRL
jgi:uncharacterized RDD family membrane protein YckC